MGCKIEKDAEGRTVSILCGRNFTPKCQTPGCKKPGNFLCDFIVGDRTCDVRMCEDHRNNVEEDKDLCADHARLMKVGDPNYQSGHSIDVNGNCNMGCC